MTTSVLPVVPPFDPYLDTLVISDAGGARPSVTIHTAEDTVLVTFGGKPSASASAYRVVQVPTLGDFVITGDVVRVEGALILQGWTMTINARLLEFGPDSLGVGPSIDTSGPAPADPPAAPLKNAKRAQDGANATHTYVFIADDDNTPATVATAGAVGTDGTDGVVGNQGGWVDIRCGSAVAIAGANLSINAAGGRGGNGQDGGPGQDGGNGGCGYNASYEGISDIVKATDGANAGAGGPGGRGGRPGPGGLGGVIRVFSVAALPSAAGVSAMKASNGLGPAGAKGKRAADGQDGTPGTGGGGIQIHNMWIPDAHDAGVGDQVDQDGRGPANKGPKPQTSPTLSPTATYAQIVTTSTPEQLRMLGDRVQRDRLVLDTTSQDEMTAFIGRLRWLQNLSTANTAAPTPPWLQSLRLTTASATQLLSDPSLDAFGHTFDWAPLVSMADYSSLLGDKTTGSISLLATMEEEWSTYRTARDTALASTAQYDSAVAKAGQRDTQLHDQLTIAWTNLADLTTQIDDSVDELAVAQQKVLDHIADFTAQVKSKLNLSFTQFLQVISQAAFASAKGGQRAVVGGVGVLGFVSNAFTTVDSDTGQSLPKDYLINKMDVYGDTVKDLDEAYSTMSGQIGLDDPNAYKLLCTQQTLDNLLGSYTSFPGAKDSQTAMDDYVKLVLARNGKILAYNACASLIVQLTATRQQLKAQQSEAQSQAAVVVTPTLDGFIQALYDVARQLCITDLYNLSRAYRFWSLEDIDLLGDVLRLASLADVNSAAVMAAQQQLLVRDVQNINSLASKLQPQKDPVVISFSAASRPHLLQSLVKDRRKKATDSELPRFCTFTLDPATADSTEGSNPFVGMLNVRLVEVRCWLIGLDSAAGDDGIVRVHLTQQGDETIIPSDAPFIPVSVTHDPVSSVFSYKAGTTEPSPDAIETPATYWDPDVGSQTILHVPALTPIGPFATWQIALRPQETGANVDWTKLTEIRLEFFVRYHGVKP